MTVYSLRLMFMNETLTRHSYHSHHKHRNLNDVIFQGCGRQPASLPRLWLWNHRDLREVSQETAAVTTEVSETSSPTAKPADAGSTPRI